MSEVIATPQIWGNKFQMVWQFKISWESKFMFQGKKLRHHHSIITKVKIWTNFKTNLLGSRIAKKTQNKLCYQNWKDRQGALKVDSESKTETNSR